jgi:hypothetical protein
VQSCGYQDVHVMWQLLHQTSSSEVSNLQLEDEDEGSKANWCNSISGYGLTRIYIHTYILGSPSLQKWGPKSTMSVHYQELPESQPIVLFCCFFFLSLSIWW